MITVPSVGIFWFVPRSPERSQLLFDRTPLADAEPYGEMLTHDRGHAEFWDHLAECGPESLVERDLPIIIVDSEYDQWPRGRVVFDGRTEAFVIYADRQLLRPNFIAEIKRIFGLVGSEVGIMADQHYARSARIGGEIFEVHGG